MIKYRTALVVLLLAAMGGVALWAVKGNFADYAALLKYLGWAAAAKSGWEHHVATRTTKGTP